MAATALSGGFADASRDAAHAFRAAMRAMARPGQVERLTGAAPPAPLSPAAGALLLTLCDADTPVYLAGAVDCADVRAWIAFQCGAPHVAADLCTFAVGAWADLVPLDRFPAGTAEYPDRSATLIVDRVPDMAENAVLSGPGLAAPRRIGLPDPVALAANAARFPLGLDLFFTSGDRAFALPRATRIEVA